jgi:hypothetical protein
VRIPFSQKLSLAAVAVLFGTLPAFGEGAKLAYFMFEQTSPNTKTENFIFALINQATIDEARMILSGEIRGKRSVQGTIIKQRVPYNPEWSFHLEPASIAFFEMAIEVCDANVRYVESHLPEVGSDFLPKNHWCPWSSRLIKEVTDQIDLSTGRPLNPLN